MVVVAREHAGECGVRIDRLQARNVAVAAADVEHALVRQGAVREVGVELALAEQVLLLDRGVVAEIAEILRPVMVRDVVVMRVVAGVVGGVERLEVVAELVPGPVGGRQVLAGDGADVVLDVGEIERGVLVGGEDLLDLVAHERQRQRGVGLRDRGRGRALVVDVLRRLDRGRVEVRAGERRGVVNHGHARLRERHA